MDDFRYSAYIVAPPDATTCRCANCDWAGTFETLSSIGDAYLTPGDPSPAGRCPECDALAYVAGQNNTRRFTTVSE